MKKILLIFVLLLISIPAYATTYYVRKDGNDSTCNGTVDTSSSSAPNCAKLTVQAGVNLAYAGDTVQVATGDYTPTPTFTTARAGSSGSPITIKAKSGNTVSIAYAKVNHAYNTVQGFTIASAEGFSDPGILLDDATGSIVENCTFIGKPVLSQAFAVVASGANITIRNNSFNGDNTLDETWGAAIWIWGGGGATISGNTISNLNSTERGIEIHGSGITISGNTIANWNWTSNDYYGYDVAHPDIFQWWGSGETSSNIIIERNIFYNIDGQIGNVRWSPTDDNSIVWTFRNNIFANISQPMFNWETMYWYNNLFYNCSNASPDHSHPISSASYGGRNYLYNNAFVGSGYQDGSNKGYCDGVDGGSNNFVSTISGGAKSGLSGSSISVNGGTLGFIAPYTNCVSNTCNFQIGATSSMVNAGTTIGSFFNDLLGLSRPAGVAWDIGPYEYDGTGGGTPPALVLDNLSPSGVQACNMPPLSGIMRSLTTSNAADCYLSTSDLTYAQMQVSGDRFDTDEGGMVTTHEEMDALSCGQNHTFYVACSDMYGQVAYGQISFSIASPGVTGPGGMRISGGARIGN